MLRLARTTRSSVLVACLIALGTPVRGASDFLSLGIWWTAHLDSPLAAIPVVGEAHVYLPLRNGTLHALAIADGKTAWTAEVGPLVGVASDRSMVVAVTETGITGFDANTGEQAWRLPVTGVRVAPSARAGWLVVGVEHELLAFRIADGHLVWRLALGAGVRARVTIDGDRVFVPLDDGSVAAVAITYGQPLWRVRMPAPPGEITTAGDRLYLGCADNFFYALDAEDGDRDWRWRASAALLAPVAYDDSRVYYTALDNVLRAVDAGSGVLKWRYAMDTRPLAGPARDEDLLILAGGAELRAVRASNGTLAGTWTAPGELAAAPVLVTGQAGPVVGNQATDGEPIPEQPGAGAFGTRVIIVTGATTGDWRVYGLARSVEPAPRPLTETPGRPLSPDVPPAPPESQKPVASRLP